MARKNTAELRKGYADLRMKGAELDAFIQELAVATLDHYKEFEDVRLVNELYTSMPKGARKAAMTHWLFAFAKVKANTDPKTKADQPFMFDAEKNTNVEAAEAKMWYDFKPDPTPDMVVDIHAAIRSLLKKVGNATSLKNGDLATVKAIAVAAGLSEHDAPSKLADIKAPATSQSATADAAG